MWSKDTQDFEPMGLKEERTYTEHWYGTLFKWNASGYWLCDGTERLQLYKLHST